MVDRMSTKYAERVYFGGSRVYDAASGPYTIGLYAKRVHVFDPDDASVVVTIPTPAAIGLAQWNHLGGPLLYILNVSSTYSMQVTDGGAFDFDPLGPGEALTLAVTPNGWSYRWSAVGGGTIIPPQQYWGNATLDATLSDLAGVWKLDDAGPNLAGESTGAPTLAKGGSGGNDSTYQIGGIDNFAMRPNYRTYANSGVLPVISNTDNWTVAVWWRADSLSSGQDYATPCLWFDSNNYVALSYNHGTKQQQVQSNVGGGGHVMSDFSSYNTPADWHLTLLIRNGNTYEIWTDNSLKNSANWYGWNASQGPKLLLNTLSYPPSIASPSPHGASHSLDEITVWKKVLTTNEKTALWNTGAGRFYVQP